MLRGRLSTVLALLVASSLVCVLGVAAWLGVGAMGQANRIDAASRVLAETVQRIERDNFARAKVTVDGLAQHPVIAEHTALGNAATATVDAVLLQARLTVAATIVMVLDPSGKVISCSSTGMNLVGNNYAFRPYFFDAMRGRRIVYGAIGVTTHRRGFYFSAPIGSANSPLGVAVAKVELDAIDLLLSQLPQPALLVSSDQVVFAANRSEWLYHSGKPLSQQERRRLDESKQFDDTPIDALPFDAFAERVTLGDTQYSPVAVPLGMAPGFRLVLLDPVRDYPLTKPQRRFVFGTTLAVLVLSGLVVALMLANARRARAERRLRRTEMHLSQTLDTIEDAVITTDRSGVVTRMNPAAEQLTGVVAREAIGSPLESVLHRCPATSLQLPLPESAIGTAPLLESRLARLNGEELRIVERTTPMRGGPGESMGSVFVARDVTEENRLREQLLQAQKMEAIGRLAGGIAHDFNNFLAIILGNAELVVHKLDNHPMQNFAREIVHTAARASELTRQLLTFSRKASLKTAPVDIHSILDETVSLFSRGLDPAIRVRQNRQAASTVVQGDATQLQSALLNLCINARDAMPNGGTLTIHTRNSQELVAKPTTELSRTGVEVLVEDEGTGIPDSAIEHIFEPFFTTKSEGRGTGLGLAAVYGCVKSHQGHIDVESPEGKGTRFRLWLPTVDLLPARESETQFRPSTSGGHIIVVDADTALRNIAARSLAMLGYRVTVCDSLEGALNLIGEGRDQACAIMLEPRTHGYSTEQLAAKIRKIAAELPILFTSALPEEPTFADSPQPHIAFLLKPFRVQKLGRVLEELLADSRAKSQTTPTDSPDHP